MLGHVTFAPGDNGTQSIQTLVDNTPLGVFNGSFSALSKPAPDGGRLYESHSRTTRKSRDISYRITPEGQVEDLSITPPRERTVLSDVRRVPMGVLDPVAAFARLVAPRGCPGGFRLYDGRRVVQVSLTDSARDGRHLRCEMGYDVVAGPGHLSPLYLSHFRMKLDYQQGERGVFHLQGLRLRGGIFTLRLKRE